MGEENQSKNRTRASKISDQNQAPNTHNANQQKPKSSWGSNIVKGFTADKKTKHQTAAAPTRRVLLQPPSNSESVTQRNPLASSQTRAKRSLIGDLSCSANATQVHPQGFPAHRRQSSGSRDLFTELEHLRGLLQEAKERESKLQAEVEECKKSGRVLELEREVEVRKGEVDDLAERVGLLESEKASLCEQLEVLGSILRANEDVGKKEESEVWKAPQSVRDLEMEVLELRRLNKELQLQKRNLACKLSAMESQLASLSNSHERDAVAKFKAEVSNLRHANEDLCKQVEGLQLSRLNEVEELAYLRWVNSCLRDELRNSCSVASSRKESTPCSSKKNSKSVGSPDFRKSRCLEFSSPKTVKLIKKLREGSITSEDLSSPETADQHRDKTWGHFEERISPQRRHSISGSKCSLQQLMLNKKRHDGFMSQNELEKEVNVPSAKKHEFIHRMDLFGDCPQSNRTTAPLDIEKRALRVPNPPPRPSCSISDGDKDEGLAQIIHPPPPPPPPPRFSSKSSTAVMQRAPQVVEFYHSLMKRDSRKDYSTGGVSEGPDVESVRSNMIDEIENRSSHLLAIKADVETQGEFVNALIKEVNCAVYQNIEDVVAFVKWLDDELCYLVDERAVLKHFDWPEKKADTLREAAFGYRDLKMLETEILFYEDDPRVPSDVALKKMVALSEKVERAVYNLHRTRESLIRNCKQFRIPTDWMLDNGIISKIKVGSVKLAKKYMKRVAMEIQTKAVHEKDPSMDYMLLQGVRFAFRIHQFAGGFDSETMHAFEELRDLANLLNRKLMN